MTRGDGSPAAEWEQLPGVDTTIPQPARFWDYLLGGKDNYPIDREIGERVLTIFPDLRDAARADREFLVRVVRYLVREAGIRQLLDIGTGLPTVNNTHQVAQATVPECRIVYVDNDPLVLVHARALLTSTPEGTTDYLHADVRNPARILHEAARTLDFTRPVALMLLGVINYVMDNAEAHAVVGQLVDSLPSGSHLAMSHPTSEVHAEAIEASMQFYNSSGAAPIRTRNRQEITRFFDRLELIGAGRGLVFAVAPGPQRRRNPSGGNSILRGRAKTMIDSQIQVSLRVLLRNLIVSAGDLAWIHKLFMTTR